MNKNSNIVNLQDFRDHQIQMAMRNLIQDIDHQIDEAYRNGYTLDEVDTLTTSTSGEYNKLRLIQGGKREA